MLNLRRAVAALLAGILLVVGVLCGLEVSRWPPFNASARVYSTPALLKQVQTLSQLVTVKYVMQKVIVWEDPPKSVLGQFFAGDNRIVLLAEGDVKAGVDLTRLKPDDLQFSGKRITVRLPRAQVTDAYLDDSETKVIERNTGFLRSFDKNLEQNTRRDAVEDIRNAALRGGILKDADDRAREELTSFFRLLGFEQVEFKSP